MTRKSAGNRSLSIERRRTRSVATQTARIGIQGDTSNYDTLNKYAATSMKTPAFASTPTTSSGRVLSQKPTNTTDGDTNDSSIEMPKEIMPNRADLKQSHLHGKSSMLTNQTEINTNSKSRINSHLSLKSHSRTASTSKHARLIEVAVKNKTPPPPLGPNKFRFYIDDNKDDLITDDDSVDANEFVLNTSKQHNTPMPVASRTRLNESVSFRTRSRESLTRMKNNSLSVGVKKTKPALNKKVSRSLSGLNEVILDNNMLQPTTSANASGPSKNKKKSSIRISKINQIQPQPFDTHVEEEFLPPHLATNRDETYVLPSNNLNHSVYDAESTQHSLQHQDSGLVPQIKHRRAAIKRLASQRAVYRRNHLIQLLRDFDAEINALRNFNHATSTVRRSERLRMKRLRKLLVARGNLVVELNSEQDARGDYERENAPKRGKNSSIQPPIAQITMKFVTLRPSNEGYSKQKVKKSIFRRRHEE